MAKFIELTLIGTDRKIYVNGQSITSVVEYGEFRLIELINGKSYSVIETYDNIRKKINKVEHFTIENINEIVF